MEKRIPMRMGNQTNKRSPECFSGDRNIDCVTYRAMS